MARTVLEPGLCQGLNPRFAATHIPGLRRHFSEEQLIELAAPAAFENFRARNNRVFDVGSDGLYRKGLRFKQH